MPFGPTPGRSSRLRPPAARSRPEPRRPARTVGSLLVALLAAVVAAGAAPAEEPVGVSPGHPDRAVRSTGCPSFDWGRVEGALRYELVVYALGSDAESLEEDDAALAEHVPGSALGWTPSLDRCLAPGGTYAWSVRAVTGEGPTGWARPLFFEVEPAPTEEQVLRILEALRRRDETRAGSGAPRAPEASLATGERPPGERRRVTAPTTYSGGGPAALRVKGEVRTIDATGEPRLWGRGRPGTFVYGRSDQTFCSSGSTRYGLSDTAASWGTAADACPEGTWVCRQSDVSGAPACDTIRPDLEDSDYLECDGVNWGVPANQHPGWLADSVGRFGGRMLREDGVLAAEAVCAHISVWCCFL